MKIIKEKSAINLNMGREIHYSFLQTTNFV